MKKATIFLLVLSANLFTVHGQTQYGNQKPNIIFIMADDLGSGELGTYGNTFNETPNLDKLAREGTKYMQAYAAAPNCSPTRASILTGQYPARVGITDYLPEGEKTNKWLDPQKHVTLNEALSIAGYHTGIVGKWHLDTQFDQARGDAKAHGFDEVIGSETKYIANGDYFFPYDKINTFTSGSENEYLTDRQNSEAVDFINRNKNNPFFLYLSYYSVHTKLDAPESLVQKYKKKFDLKYGKGAGEKIYGPHNLRHSGSHKDNPYLAAMLESIDQGIGEIMHTVEENGLAKNTLIIFFSDNGGAGKGANNGNLKGSKMWLYEGGIRVPLIMRWIDVIQPESQEQTPVSSIDFYPTFLDIAKARRPEQQILDGQSLVPLFSKNPLKRKELYWHYPSETAKLVPNMASVIRQDEFKLIEFYADNRIELYNLKNDPGESNNLADALPDKSRQLKRKLNAWKLEVRAEKPVIPVDKLKASKMN